MSDGVKTAGLGRRHVLGSGLVAAAALAAPAIATAQGQTTTWRVQTAWSGGAGLDTFREWCGTIIEKTKGQLAFEALDPSNGIGGFDIYTATKEGRVDACNVFTLYSERLFNAGVFLSSYPMAMRTNAEFDVFYYGLGGLEMARELFAQHNLHFVGIVHHGPNIIHSKKPIYRFDDFRGLKMRVPGGMVSELFSEMGAETISMPGEKIFGALQSGEIDCADYVGPAINYSLGFSNETRFISMGPPGYMSVYQPVDLMDLSVNMDKWQALSPEMQDFLETEIQAYSNFHYSRIQEADQQAWTKFEVDGTTVIRLSSADVEAMTKLALPIWQKYAKRDADSARVFTTQLNYMKSGSLGYVDEVMADFILSDL
ncbi:MAG: TRAP transporter substrate-binding protein DctP [Pseudomonadota bacterium]